MKRLSTLLFFLTITAISNAQKQDTLPCRALFSDPQTALRNGNVYVTKMYVVLQDGKPVKFLMADRRRETRMEVWDYKLVDDKKKK
jgi:hypothetical protein